MKTNGSCFKDALEAADVSFTIDIPDWILIENIPAVCDELGLEWNGAGQLNIGIEPVIVIYKTNDNKGHVVFVQDIGKIKADIIGVIRKPSHKKENL